MLAAPAPLLRRRFDEFDDVAFRVDPVAHRDLAVRYGMDALAYSQMTLSQVRWAQRTRFPELWRNTPFCAMKSMDYFLCQV